VATGFFREYEHPTEGSLREARSPFRMPGFAPLPDCPAPRAGGDTRCLLESLGFEVGEIERLVADAVIADAAPPDRDYAGTPSSGDLHERP
jgi:crotonobetainyl-CoA:carnitine CoA-transferase CaiB-like acyl-CoA transferase